jgi:hypothetical protein
MNIKEVRIQFRAGSYVGIGNGMLYCKGDDVIKINGSVVNLAP